MPLNVGSRIRAFFSPLLRALGMSSDSSPAYFEWPSRSGGSVELYSKFLGTHYRQTGTDMNGMRVTELRLVKQLDKGSEHEYIVACVTTPNGKTLYLCIERLRDTQAVARASQSDSTLARTSSIRDPFPSGSPFSPSSSKSSLDSFDKHSEALDVVRSMDEPLQKPGDRVLGRLKFTGTRPFYLYELAVLATTIHDSQRCYNLFTKNCYWFAGLLVNILEYEYGLELEVGEGSVKPGSWGGFQIIKPAPEHLSAVANDFREHLRIFQEKVAEFQESQRRLEEAAERERENAKEAVEREREKARENEQRLKEAAEREREKARENEQRNLKEAVEREREKAKEAVEREREKAKEAVERERERMLKWMREQGIQAPI